MKSSIDSALRSAVLNSMYADKCRHGFLLSSLEDNGHRNMFDVYEILPKDTYYFGIIANFLI